MLIQITRLRDGGGIYKETNLDNVIVEPFNAATAAIFIGIAIYWIIKCTNSGVQKSLFVFVCSLVLLIGGIGGTIYHAFRIHQVFLVMDWLPIMLLCFGASVYLLVRVTGKWWHGILYCFSLFAIQFLMFGLLFPALRSTINPQLVISISYVFLAFAILIPLFLYLRKTAFKKARWVYLALASFVLAVSFRSLDAYVPLPIGTHFLWHLLGAAACHFMFRYIFETREQK